MRGAVTVLGQSLVLITPGAALAMLQEWTPFLLAVAGMAGTALAIAVRNYNASKAQETRLNSLEQKVPKRSTDRVTAYPSAQPASTSLQSQDGPVVIAAGSPVSGEVGTDG